MDLMLYGMMISIIPLCATKGKKGSLLYRLYGYSPGVYLSAQVWIFISGAILCLAA